MNGGLVLWDAARVCGLAALAALAGAVLTGMALRTAYLAPLAGNRAVLSLHAFLTWFWVPLIAAHIVALVLDATARVTPLDVVVPFAVSYSPAARVATGLGTAGLLLLVVVSVSTAMRRRLSPRLWRWLHRISSPLFAVLLLHAQLAGSDLSRAGVSVAAWAVAGLLAALAVARAAGARVGVPAVATRSGGDGGRGSAGPVRGGGPSPG